LGVAMRRFLLSPPGLNWNAPWNKILHTWYLRVEEHMCAARKKRSMKFPVVTQLKYYFIAKNWISKLSPNIKLKTLMYEEKLQFSDGPQ
jgi:hypothetical protein